MEVIRCYRDRFLEIGSLSWINSIGPEQKRQKGCQNPPSFSHLLVKHFFITSCFHSIFHLIALWMLLTCYIDASSHLYSYDMKTEVRLGKGLWGGDKEELTGWAQSKDMTVFYIAHHVQGYGTHLIHAAMHHTSHMSVIIVQYILHASCPCSDFSQWWAVN